jgi:O-antigen/teichoic acid export membrane protein
MPDPSTEDHPVLRSDLRKVTRNTVLRIGGGSASGIGRFALTVVVARSFGASGAGAFFSGLAVFTFVSIVCELGADTGFVRTIPRFRALGRTEEIRRTLVVGLVPVFVISSLLAIGLLAFAAPLTRLIAGGAGSGTVISYIRTLAPFVPLSAVSTVMLAATIGYGTVVPTVLVDNVGKPLVRPILAAVVIALGAGATALALSWALPIVVGLGVASVFLFTMTRRAESIDLSVHPDVSAVAPVRSYRELGSEFWRFSAPRALAGALEGLLVRLDILLVGGLATTAVAGIYAASSRLLGLGSFVLGAVITAISPQISVALAVEDHDRAEALFQTCTWWLMIPSWAIYLLLAIYSPLVLRLFGTQFERGSFVLTLLSLSMLVTMATGPVSSVLLMGGFSVWNLVNSIAGMTAMVGLNVLLVPRFGLTGAAIAGSVAIMSVQLAAAIEVWFLLRLEPLGRGFRTVALAAIGCVGVPALLSRAILGPTIPGFVLTLLVSVPAYLFVLRRSATALRFSMLREALRGGKGAYRLVDEVIADRVVPEP